MPFWIFLNQVTYSFSLGLDHNRLICDSVYVFDNAFLISLVGFSEHLMHEGNYWVPVIALHGLFY